jgi:hypothetical protein
MSAYVPLVIGESNLRQPTEALLCPTPGVIEDRINELDAANRLVGRWATFGTEVEFSFADDPGAAEYVMTDVDTLYDSVQDELDPYAGKYNFWHKGAVLYPDQVKGKYIPFMGADEHWDDDKYEGQAGIREIRTAPGGALEALDLYWDVIQAVGKVAAANGRIGLIHSTHVSAAVIRDPTLHDRRFVNFRHETGGRIMAAAQHNLNSLHGLQLHAGLESGVEVQEAYPNKNAATAVENNRLEMRHPLVGIADPRLDMLAVLSAVQDEATGQVGAAALAKLRRVEMLDIMGTSDSAITTVLGSLALHDPQTGRMVMPAGIYPGAYGPWISHRIDGLLDRVTAGRETSWIKDEGAVLRNMIDMLRLEDNGRFTVAGDSKDADRLRRVIADVSWMPNRLTNRVVPVGIVDSPNMHLLRRPHIGKSSVVRRVLGPTTGKLTKTPDAVAARQELIDQAMVIVEPEEF